MKKIYLSLATIGAVAALAVFVTSAFFSDTETSEGNTFEAGQIDLEVGVQQISANNGTDELATEPFSLNGQEALFNFTDLKPGDEGMALLSLLVNDNNAWACGGAEVTAKSENTLIDPEVEASDATNDPNGGELQNYLQFAIVADTDDDGVLDTNGEDEVILPPTILDGFSTSGWVALNDSVNDYLTGAGAMAGGETYQLFLKYCFGSMDANLVCSGAPDANDAQTDSVVGKLMFYAVQSRNNGQFTCDSLNTPETLVGADLGDYQAPTCTTTVGVGQTTTSIQAGVDAAADSSTVCVADGTYNETVVINKPLVLASVNGPTNTATIQGGVRIESNDVSVKGFIVNPGSMLGENAAFYLNGSLSGITIQDNDINGLDESPSRGIIVSTGSTYSSVMIKNNLLHDLTTGLYANPHTGTLEFKYNDVYENVAGVGGFTGVHVAYNHFSGTATEAIGADSSYDGVSVVEYNNFMTGQDVNVYASITPNLQAPNNFWAEGAVNQTTAGEVDYTPEALAAYPQN